MNDAARNTAIYALTPQGAALGRRLAEALGGTLYTTQALAESAGAVGFDSLPQLVAVNFAVYARHVFVTAAGVAVRCMCEHLTRKDTDPAVVCLDQKGTHVISLISGHLGGANDLAREVAAVTGGTAVITTATDTADAPAIDLMAQKARLVIAEVGRIKEINGPLAAGDKVQMYDPGDWLRLSEADNAQRSAFLLLESLDDWDEALPGVIVTDETDCTRPNALLLHPPSLRVGVGCRRDARADDIEARILDTLAEHGLVAASLVALGSIDVKQDEPGLIAAARRIGVRTTFFDADTLYGVAVPTPSSVVASHVGTPSVSEAAALLLGGPGSMLIPKTVGDGVTVAVARLPRRRVSC